MNQLSCFKAYDIRGRVPDELNPELAFKIARAISHFLTARCMVVGMDIRLSSPAICDAICKGLIQSGVDVINIGLCGTEEVYFATRHYEACGGIMITASHNPQDYNGLKLVRENAKPISSDTGLNTIHDIVINHLFPESVDTVGTIHHKTDKSNFIAHLLSLFDVNSFKPFKVVCNAGNGMAGPVIDKLKNALPFEFIKLHNTPDGTFPNGIPNPMLPDNRQETAEAVRTHKADFGIAWDGDFDRCFFFDEHGEFIESYYIIGLIAEYFLTKHPQQTIIHDPRLKWHTESITQALGGQTIENKTGHAFMKERMRKEDAIYGGEMSGHHYFKHFNYCDSGMLPWLVIAKILSEKKQTLGTLVHSAKQQFLSLIHI